MKKFFLILIVLHSIVPFSFGQEKSTKIETIDTLQNTSIVSDEGHWFGIRLGWQTKPYMVYHDWRLSDWWTLFAEYEYHLDKNWSLLADYHLFREKRCLECEADNKSSIGASIKLGYHILDAIKLSGEAGIAFGRRIAYYGLEIPYGGSLDITLNKDFIINFNLRTFLVPDYGYWITTGLKYKILN